MSYERIADLEKRDLNGTLGALGFILLFPGFFFYHTLLGLGSFPAFLGGFFRPMALVFIFVFGGLALITKSPRIGRLGPAGWLFMLICEWITLSATWHYLVGTQVGNLAMLDWSISVAFLNVTCYLIARHLPLRWPAFQVVFAALLGLMIGLVFLLAKDGMFHLRILGLIDQEKIASYQEFGRSLVVTGIVVVAFTRGAIYRAAICAATVAALYVNSARSEFVCSTAALLALWAVHALVYRARVLPLIVWAASVSLLPFVSLEMVQSALPDNRTLQLLKLEESSSAVERAELSKAGWEVVGRNPFFGNYASYYDNEGVGGYPHSLLAAWVNLGFVGVALYCALFGVMIRVQFSTVSGASLRDPVVTAGLLMLVLCAVALLFAKDYSYLVTAFAVAFTDRAWSAAQYQTAKSFSQEPYAALS